MAAVKLQRPHLLCLEIIECPLTAEEVLTRVDTDIPKEKNIPGIGIVLGVVCIDRQITIANLDVVISNSRPIFKPSISISRDLHRFVREIAKLGTERGSGTQKEGQYQKETAHLGNFQG